MRFSAEAVNSIIHALHNESFMKTWLDTRCSETKYNLKVKGQFLRQLSFVNILGYIGA